MMKPYIQHINFLILLILGLFACQKTDSTQAVQPTTEVNLAPKDDGLIRITQQQFEEEKMAFGKFSTTKLPTWVQTNGEVEIPPESKTTISVFYGGSIKNLKLKPGQSVRKGQVLFLLENPDFIKIQQDYLENKAQLKYFKAELERQKVLANEKISAKKNLLKAEMIIN